MIKTPTRTCIACRARTNKADLLRICVDKNACLVLDNSKAQTGRGAYIHDKKDCVAKLAQDKVLQRVFKRGDSRAKLIKKESVECLIKLLLN